MILLYGLIALIVYFIVLSILLGNAHNKNVIFHITQLFSIIYICILAVLGILCMASDGLGQVAFSFFVMIAAAYMFYALFRLGSKKSTLQWNKTITAVTVSYLIAVMYITVFSRTGEGSFEIKMDLGAFLTRTLSGVEPHALKHGIQNVGMFIPLGVLVPHCFRNLKSYFLHTALFGLTFSVMIEMTQLFMRCGSCDVDDIIMNVMGVCIGGIFSQLFAEFII